MSEPMDSKLRELTYRLMAMAPEAPPFPEEEMVQLNPSPVPAPPTRHRNPLVWVGVAAVAALLIVGVPLLLLRGGSAPNPSSTVPPGTQTTETPSTTAPVSTASFDVTLYFLADYVENSTVVGPHIVPVRRQVTAAVTNGQPDAFDSLNAALSALLEGPTTTDDAIRPGVSSAIPDGTELLGVTADQQPGAEPRVTIDFNKTFESGAARSRWAPGLPRWSTRRRSSGTRRSNSRSTVKPVDVFSSEGLVLDGPQTRDDYRDLLPSIFVEQPLPGDTVIVTRRDHRCGQHVRGGSSVSHRAGQRRRPCREIRWRVVARAAGAISQSHPNTPWRSRRRATWWSTTLRRRTAARSTSCASR